MSHPTTPREQFQEAVMCFRKAAYEFGVADNPDDHETMLTWQRRIFGLYDQVLPAQGSEPFERWRKELRACIVQLLYVAHESKSPAECKSHPLYGSVMRLVDGGPSLATLPLSS